MAPNAMKPPDISKMSAWWVKAQDNLVVVLR